MNGRLGGRGDNMARGKLVVFSPHTDLTSYMPNVSLATLAGSLLDYRHSVTIDDYGTIDEIERLAPLELRKGLMDLYPTLMDNGLKRYLAIPKLKGTLKEIDSHHQRRTHEIAEDLLNECESDGIDFIGFQGWMGQGMLDTIYAAEHIKRYRPQTKIFLGGSTVDQARGAIYKRTGAFDALAFGDGDETIIGLARYSEGSGGLSSIPNIIYKDGTGTVETEMVFVKDLNGLTLPVYDGNVYPAMNGHESKIKIGVIDDSRGCIYHCFFCPHLVKSGNEWRLKSPDRMLDEVGALRKYGITHWRKSGSNPPLKSDVKEAELYHDAGIETFWTAFGHIKQIDPEKKGALKALSDGGLIAMSFGIENGDPEIREKIFNKAIGDNEEIKRALKATMDSGIYTVGSFIYPSPFETREGTQKTLELIYDGFSNTEMSSPQFYPPGLFPQSEWGRDSKRFGFELDKPEEYPDGYVLEAMEFVLNRRLPPNLWRNSLPYSLNGKPFKKVLGETYRFCKGLKKDGISINIPEEYVLFWHALDQKGMSVEEFSNTASRAVYTMDLEIMKDIAQSINEKSRRR